MNSPIRYLHENHEYIIFEYLKRHFLFIVQFSGLFELSSEKIITGEDNEGDPKLSPEFITSINGILSLIREEELFTNKKAVEKDRGQKVSVSAVNLNLTPRCNLACVYCYAKGGDYERLDGDMKIETVMSALREALPYVDNMRDFRFEFFGGEPLLNLDAIGSVLDWEEKQNEVRKPIINRISSNLTEYSGEVERILERGNFILSISIDGGRETQNSQRPYRGGPGSYDDIIANAKAVKSKLPHLPLVARMTVYNNAPGLLDEVRELVAMNIFDYCSIYSAAIDDRGRGEVYMTDDFKKSFMDLAESYNELLAGEKNIFKGCLELNRYIGHILNGTCATNHCRAGIGYFSLSPDGSVHPCHRLIGRSEFEIKGGFKNIDSTPDFWKTTVDMRDRCSLCAIRYFCGGGCKQEALISTGDPLGVSCKSCDFSRLLFESALAAFVRLAGVPLEKVRRSSEKLSEMFVLCGQNIAASGRENFEGRIGPELKKFLL